jgi:transglutaminase-like putative cysteine protease
MSAKAPALTPAQFALTAASVTAAVLPHLLRLPLLFVLLVAGLLAGRIVQRAAGGARIPGLLKVPLVLLIPVLVVLHYGNVFGREPGSALACAMLALKLIETETRRDARSAIAFSCFVLMSALLFNSGMGFTLLLCAALALFLATLRELELRPVAARSAAAIGRRAAAGLRTGAVSLLAAIPLTLCVFVFLPRLGSPLWGAPTDAAIGHSGLGDSMDPGNLQELLIDDSPAFRVSFDGALPERSKLYWRGPVLTRFDGMTWSRASLLADARRRAAVEQTGEIVGYEVTLEPSDRRWLLALDVPMAAPDNAVRGADMTLVAARPVDQLLRYRASSALSYRLGAEAGDHERERNLALPPGFDPKSRALAAQWRRDLGSDDAVIRAALDLYRNSFTYSLAAPELGRNSVDDFLFETRKGFCQHFASSFTFLMRAAGIPARVVTGYQGGYFNQFGNYLVVRQSDAHAWSEVWLAGRGWVRVDPTGAVSPQRVESGARAAAGAAAAWYQADWLLAVRNRFDLVNRAWNNLVVQFSLLRQQNLLTPFGIAKAEYYDLVWVLVGSSTLLLALYSWWVLRRPRKPGDALDAAYSLLCRKLEGIGMPRAASEGPVAFAGRLHRADGSMPAVDSLIRRYAGLRYAHAAPDAAAVREFAGAVRTLRVPRAFAKIYNKPRDRPR